MIWNSQMLTLFLCSDVAVRKFRYPSAFAQQEKVGQAQQEQSLLSRLGRRMG
jgi:hypothetical protein